MQFIDEAKIHIQAGKGGAGSKVFVVKICAAEALTAAMVVVVVA